MLCGMAAVVPGSADGWPAGQPVYWLPLGLFGVVVVVLSVPLYAVPLNKVAPLAGWADDGLLTRTVVSSSSSPPGFGGFFTATVHLDGGVLGVAEGWYWAVALIGVFLLTALWYRWSGARSPGWVYLVTGVLLTSVVTVAPLLVMRRASFPAWLWLSGEWASGTLAFVVIAVALWMLACRARSRPLMVVALAYTAAVSVVGWPALRSAPWAFSPAGDDPMRSLALIGPQLRLGAGAAVLPGLVLLAGAVCVVVAPRLGVRSG